MGLDFITTTQGGIQKGWDTSKQRLTIAQLDFTCPPEKKRTVQVQPIDSNSANIGNEFTVKEDKGVLLIMSKGAIVGVCKNPPRSVLEGISGLGGYGAGKLDRVKEISGMWDVEIYLEPLVKDVEK